MGPKRKHNSSDTYISLEQAVGPVRFLRVTITKDSKNKRNNYCINFYSGSRDDGDAVSVLISGRSQLQISIPDHEFEKSNVSKEEYARKKIVGAVQQLQTQASKALFTLTIVYR